MRATHVPVDAIGFSKKTGLRRWIAVLIVVGLAISSLQGASVSAQVETLIAFDGNAGEYPEGIAVDSDGAIYASLTPLGLLVRIAPGQTAVEEVGSVELDEGDLGLTGLAVGPDGSVYGAVVSANPQYVGVWRFDVESGNAERVPGTENVLFPNGVAFDEDGAMFVTDSAAGSIWTAAPGEPAALWVEGPMLAGDQSIGLPFPLGANGIAVADGQVYVSVTEQGTVLSIPVEPDGSAGDPELIAEFTTEEGAKAVDGVAVDSQGNIFVTFVIAHEIWEIAPDGAMHEVATADDGLDAPASIAIGPNADGIESAYVTNFSAYMEPFLTSTGVGPGVLELELSSM